MVWKRLVVGMAFAVVTWGCGDDGAESPTSPEDALWLLAQSAENASLERRGGGRLLLTLEELAPVTVAFTDRPDRDSRSIASTSFLQRWGALFDGDPPNAALVLAEDGQRTLTLTLHSARHSAGGTEAYFSATPVDADVEDLPLGLNLGVASLFIDDAPDPASLGPGDSSASIELTVTATTEDSLVVSFMGLNGNQPQTYGNSIVVWEGPDVRWDQPPVTQVPIPTNATAGAVAIPSLAPQQNPYAIAYTVGPSPTSIATVTTALPGEPTGDTQTTTLSIDDVMPTGFVVDYQLPAGSDPSTLGHWVGVWEGSMVAWSAPPIARTTISGSSSQGTAAIEGFDVLRGVTYTLGYFAGPNQTELAATVSITE